MDNSFTKSGYNGSGNSNSGPFGRHQPRSDTNAGASSVPISRKTPASKYALGRLGLPAIPGSGDHWHSQPASPGIISCPIPLSHPTNRTAVSRTKSSGNDTSAA